MSDVNLIVRGRHYDVSSRFREHVAGKLERIGRFGVPLDRVDVEVSKENNPRQADRAFEVELTCRSGRAVIRAEAHSADKYSALDIAYGRLEERLRRVADKHRYHRHGRASQLSAAEVADIVGGINAAAAVLEAIEEAESQGETVEASEDGVEVFVDGPVVVREKVHETSPMSVEQAVTEMELVDHNFFLFKDVESGLPSVVYRRRGYDYGLIRITEVE